MATNKQYKFAFIHITKTGGVTIETELGWINGGDGHNSYNYYEDKYPDYEKYAVVRNPYDRFISSFFFAKKYDKKNNTSKYKFIYERGLVGLINLMLSDKPDTGKFSAELLIKPQYKFVCTGTDIKCKIYNFETFYQTYKSFCNKTGISPKAQVPVHNTSNHKPYKEYYTEELKNKVYEYYKLDFQIFNYKKEL